MKAISLYFQVHQPFRLRRYRFFDIGNDHYYFDDYSNRTIMEKVANNCYLPANKILLDLIKEHGKKFKLTFSITGSAIEQFEKYAPAVLDSFKELAATGNVEFLAETYAHSLASLKSEKEFKAQVKLHRAKMKEHFNVTPKIFRNTELIYSDEIGEMVGKMGYKGILTEGAKHVLGWKSPNYLYSNALNPKIKVLLKNFRLSDDIAFRFSNQGWNEWPLTSEKLVDWIDNMEEDEDILNLFMDYETFGEHQHIDTGIFDFLKAFPTYLIENTSVKFVTPSEAVKKFDVIAPVHVPNTISWADEERDLTAWLGNELQDEAFDKLYSLHDKIYSCSDEQIKHDWLLLQTSDHFYYMCTKWFSDGDVHKYFNPYNSPYDAFVNYMNVLSDFISRVNATCPSANLENLSMEELERITKRYQSALRKMKAASKK
jgi:alpha-amylase